MAESLPALAPVNSQGGAILTFVFPMLLFLVIGGILWGLFAGWDWPVSRRVRPASVHHFQAAIARGNTGMAMPAAAAAPRAAVSGGAGPGEPEPQETGPGGATPHETGPGGAGAAPAAPSDGTEGAAGQSGRRGAAAGGGAGTSGAAGAPGAPGAPDGAP